MSQIGESGKILIVDDNATNVRLLDVYLRTAGYTTEKAYDGEQAMEMVRHTQPDLVLLDVMMPKLDGYEVCKRIRTNEATNVIPVIMITALTGAEDRIRGIECGADDFISKPFEKSELLARVKNLLRIKYYRSMISEKRTFDAVVEDLSHGIIVADGEYRITVMNKQAEALLGATQTETTGKDLFSAFEPFSLSPAAQAIRDSSERHVTLNLEQHDVSPAVYLSGRLTKIIDPAGNLSNVAVVFRDVSEERRRERLQRDFLSLVTHKLKTPLTIVSGYLGLIRAGKYGEMTDEMAKAFKLVESRVEDLKALIEKLLQYAGLSADELQLEAGQVRLGVVIERCMARIRSRYGTEHVEFAVDLPEDLPEVSAEVEQFALVLDNLIDNAVKFTAKDTVRVDLSARATDEMVEITVRDYGPGIPTKHLADIFSDFLQVEEWFTGNVRGLGLGLPTAKRLVENWGGTIRVESQPGEGSAFSFTIPRADRERPAERPGSGGPGHMETA